MRSNMDQISRSNILRNIDISSLKEGISLEKTQTIKRKSLHLYENDGKPEEPETIFEIFPQKKLKGLLGSSQNVEKKNNEEKGLIEREFIEPKFCDSELDDLDKRLEKAIKKQQGKKKNSGQSLLNNKPKETSPTSKSEFHKDSLDDLLFKESPFYSLEQRGKISSSQLNIIKHEVKALNYEELLPFIEFLSTTPI